MHFCRGRRRLQLNHSRLRYKWPSQRQYQARSIQVSYDSCRRVGTASKAYLANELLVRGRITIGAQGLLQKGQKNGDDNGSLQTFSKAYEEDWRLIRYQNPDA